MKKLLLSLVALFAITTASAQEFSWGIKAGVNMSTLTGNDLSANSKLDFVGGVFGEYKTNEWFGIGAEILYSGQGAKAKDLDLYSDLSYINVPILANFHVANFISLKTGVQPGFLLSQKLRSGSEKVSTNDVKSFDLSIPVGVAFQLDCGLLFDLRYNIGITNISKNADQKAQNSVLSLTVGWRF